MITKKMLAGCVCLVVGVVGLASGANAATGLEWCGYHGLSLNMEQVPTDWWAWNWNNDSMWLYNNYMDIYRYHPSNGSWGHNGDNEFGGWPSDGDLFNQWGFHWGSALAMTVFTWGCQCCQINESDILFNPAYSWTEDRYYAEDSSAAVYYDSVLLHEMGHSWGEQTENETYDYDEPTVMHSYSYWTVQDYLQLHWADAYLIRRDYDDQTSVPARADMGVMSKYALSYWRNSTVSPTIIRVGNDLSLTNVTIENTGTVALSNVRVRFYLSTDRNITSGDYQLGGSGWYWYWGSFCAECRGVYSFSPLPVPTDMPAGTYWVGAIVTSNGDSYSGDDLWFNDAIWFHDQVTVQVVPGSVQHYYSSYSVAENGGIVRVYVGRTGGADGAASVNYATANWTALAGSDYTATSGTLYWSHGDAGYKYFDVPIIDDIVREGDESFVVDLSGATGASLGFPSQTTVTILANDEIPLPQALDNLTLTWTNADPVPWFGQMPVSHDGVDAAQSGAITNSGSSAFSTVVTGPGTLTFWCRVSSEVNFDFLGWSVDGVLQAKISGEVGWALKTLTLGVGAHTVKWKYWKDTSLSAGQDCGWVDQVVWTPTVALPEALDNLTLTWTNTDPAPWLGQTAVSHDGVDAGRSGALMDNGSTAFTTVVTGPGALTFWCRVSSEASFDFLGWSVDGVLQAKISGEVGWAQKTLTLAAGAHTIKWKYWKDGSLSYGQDCGWLDQVVWTASTITLPQALDNTTLTWTNTDPAAWFGQAVVSHDGVDAGQSGAITDNGSTAFSTVVTGPGTLTFWCRVSSEASFDFLGWSVDGVLQQKISGEVAWAQKTLTIAAGAHTLKWKYWKNASVSTGQDCGWVDQVVWTPGISLADALDNTTLTWTNTDPVPWFGQTAVSHDGVDAGKSGAIADSGSTLFSTVVTGPGTVTFWCKVSSESGFDFLGWSVDGVLQEKISGEVAWAQKTLTIAAGAHTLKWKYWKNASVSTGQDCGWVDQVVWTPSK